MYDLPPVRDIADTIEEIYHAILGYDINGVKEVLGEGAKSIFKDVVVQRCIVHLIRNSIKYVPSKDYKAYTAHLKKVYGAPSLESCAGSV